jgi:hypothetical protein
MDRLRYMALPWPDLSLAASGFGKHPDYENDYASYWKRRNSATPEELYEIMWGKKITLEELTDPRHPNVFIIPRDRYINVVDEVNDTIGFMQTHFPFSSTDFWRHKPIGIPCSATASTLARQKFKSGIPDSRVPSYPMDSFPVGWNTHGVGAGKEWFF